MYNNEKFADRILRDSNLNLVGCAKMNDEPNLLVKNTLNLLYNLAKDAFLNDDLYETKFKDIILTGIYNKKKFLIGSNYTKPNTKNTAKVFMPCIFLLARYEDRSNDKLSVFRYSCLDFDSVVNTNLYNYKFPNTSAGVGGDSSVLFEIAAIIFNCSHTIKTDHKIIRNFSRKFSYILDLNKIKDLDLEIYKKINKAENGMMDSIKRQIDIKKKITIMNPKSIKSGTAENMYSELEKVVNIMLEKDNNHSLFAEEKIDGCRCIAVKKNNVIKLYKKGGDEILSLDCIKEELSVFLSFYISDCIVDGEIFADHVNYIPHELVAGMINSHSPVENCRLKYCIFDIIDSDYKDKKYCERLATLNNMFIDFKTQHNIKKRYIVKNYCQVVNSFDDVLEYIKKLREKHEKRYEIANSKSNYLSYSDSPEGIIIRSSSGIYSSVNSGQYIRKFKFIEDDEFICVGVESDIDGKIIYKFSLSGLATDDIFSAVIKASHNDSKRLLEEFRKGVYDPIGKKFKVRFRVRNNNNIPKEAFVLQEYHEGL